MRKLEEMKWLAAEYGDTPLAIDQTCEHGHIGVIWLWSGEVQMGGGWVVVVHGPRPTF
jgi:hypothetical protein